MARVSRVACKQTQNGASLGLEGTGDAALELQIRGVSPQALSVVVPLGHAQPTEAHGRKGADAAGAVAQHSDVLDAWHQQCRQRELELEDPMGEVHGPWLSQLSELRNGHLLPLRRPSSGPFTHIKPGRAKKPWPPPLPVGVSPSTPG